MHRTIISLAVGLLFFFTSGVLPAIAAPSPTNVSFDVNDISILWPVPTTSAEVNELISADDITASGAQFWPSDAFDTVIETAETVKLTDTSGRTHEISFGTFRNKDQFKETFRQPHTWKVAGVRIDPSAPGSSEKMIQQFGSIPQVRLIVQPVTMDSSGGVRVHDYTAHLVYDFVKGRSGRKFIPDEAKFADIVNDFKDLKLTMAERGISTNGLSLGVHPGFNDGSFVFEDALKEVLKKHLSPKRLSGVAFMGLEPPEPWIFFAMNKDKNGRLVRFTVPPLGNEQAQMLSFAEGDTVFPVAQKATNSKGQHGVSTASLFEGKPLSTKADSSKARPVFQDIPDIIANPQTAHFFNTDCVSCHSESARRQALNISTKDVRFQYQHPLNISGVNKAFLPNHPWNVRNFGWFPNFFTGETVDTVTMRTANETAEAAEFINREYLQHASVINTVAKENGLGGAHLRRRPEQLSALSDRDFCVLKPGELVSVDSVESVGDGFAKIDILGPNSACPSFKGKAFIFEEHFDWTPITKVVAKQSSELNGGHLRRFPMALSALASDESCLMQPNQSVGINGAELMADGFTKINVTIPSPSCPTFKGEVFAFSKHFNFD
ncbi:MAG: hypothetical protein AAF703_08490 [Cyanobacteria bacterium P01_D01_bin.105]